MTDTKPTMKTPIPPYEHYIITASDNVSILIRLRDFVLIAALWVLFFYFIRGSFPFFTDLFHWVMGGFQDVKNYPNLARDVPMIQAYLQVAVVMIAIYLGWAIYNMLRFRGRDRRKPRAAVTPDDLANMYGFSPETVQSWQDASSLVIHHDADSHITDVTVVK
ncbi:MAG: poly-beta-1,6-N-acetyl-D-glucosamine biosynthesis protein PgaD [Alphaproteobacteria bacterium]|nr:poly-beta-1,6-N-acetyl-D-glucosamine biosynthesis protein PgaD [Alphaproteobacteria bacterium]